MTTYRLCVCTERRQLLTNPLLIQQCHHRTKSSDTRGSSKLLTVIMPVAATALALSLCTAAFVPMVAVVVVVRCC